MPAKHLEESRYGHIIANYEIPLPLKPANNKTDNQARQKLAGKTSAR